MTGAGGYVGSRLVTALVGCRDMQVRALVRRRVAYLPAAEQVEVDLLGPADLLRAACDGTEVVVHLAGPNEVQAAADPDGTLHAAVAGTRRMAAAAAEAGVRRFIYVSTVHVYGSALAEGAVVTEETLPGPIHPYALARLASEHAAAATPGLELVVFRLSNSVGAPTDASVDRWSLVANDLCRQAALEGRLELATAGVQWRDFIALGDVCRIIGGALATAALPAGTYNLGTGTPMTIRQLAGLVQDAFEAQSGSRPVLRAPEPPSHLPEPYVVSVEKLAALGWRANSSVADGVAETAAFCLEHRDVL